MIRKLLIEKTEVSRVEMQLESIIELQLID